MITYYVQYCNEMHILSKPTTNHIRIIAGGAYVIDDVL